jgi:GrpB-like predicted nucleotidyltransferase (UPF0157 family)
VEVNRTSSSYHAGVDEIEEVLGLPRGEVKLVAFDPRWRLAFEVEKRSLVEALSGKILAVEHIGSTAIEGMVSKPIIDINVAVASMVMAEELVEPLSALGYQYTPEQWFEDRYFFAKGPGQRCTHHLNLCEIDSETAWLGKIWFRDYLTANPQVRADYSALKTELARRHGGDRASYTEAKGEFIRKMTEKAKLHYTRPR